MSNPVIAERGPLAGGVDVCLVAYGGGLTFTRGTFSRLDQAEGELAGAFSKSGLQCWVPFPVGAAEIEFVVIDNRHYRALDQERIVGAFDTLRIQLIPTEETILPPIFVAGEWDRNDWGDDFDIGR